jgi:hypothetical protein
MVKISVKDLSIIMVEEGIALIEDSVLLIISEALKVIVIIFREGAKHHSLDFTLL